LIPLCCNQTGHISIPEAGQYDLPRPSSENPGNIKNECPELSLNIVPFAYYRKLSKRQRRIYNESDAVSALRLAKPARLRSLVHHVASSLVSEDRIQVERTSRALIEALCEQLGVPRTKLRVRSVRPSDDWGELHGLYTPPEGRRLASIEVWMRTAQQRRVVAFRTYLRTLLHELNHHLDIELLELADSFHTEGFYKRESSLFKQLIQGTGL